MEKLVKSLLQGNYKNAEEMCKTMDDSTLKDVLLTIAYDTESICIYSFVQYMIGRSRETFWIELAIDIMINPLCFIEGAYSTALFHARELLEIEQSVVNLERLLFFHNIPERLVEEDEAKYISEKILKIDPDNKAALNVQI